jgi:CRP-like cAMP-binding protein
MKLRDFPALKLLNNTQVQNLEAACTFLEFEAGSCLMAQGSHGESLLLLLEGQVDVRVDAGEGEQPITTLTAPAVLGEMELLTGNPKTASVYARTPCRCACLDYSHLRARVEDGDLAALRFVYGMAKVLAARLSAVTRKLSELEGNVAPAHAEELKAFKAKLFGEWND